MKSMAILAVILSSLCVAPRASAQSSAPPPVYIPPGEITANYTVETVLKGLDRPCGLAIRSGWSKDAAAELYLVERGAGRILKMATDRPGATQEVIVGFPAGDVEGVTINGFPEKGQQVKVGPLGLLFLTHSKLVVCCHLEDGGQLLNVYRLPAKNSALTADQTDHQAGPVSIGNLSTDDLSTGAQSQDGRGWFCGLAKTSEAVFIASGGDSQGWILKASLQANRITDLQTFIATKKQTGRTGPAGLTINPQPRLSYLVVGLMGRIDVPRDSNLAFYSPKSGRLAMNTATGLHDLVGLSYSPAGNLFGIDFAWQVESDGGVYRLDDAQLAAKPTCRAMKIAASQRPTSMVFAPDGSLYVTAWGPASAGANKESDQKTGVLLKITGEW